MYLQGSPVHIAANSNTLETDRPQRDRAAACVIAQQYPSATFVLLRFPSRKEKVSALFKNVISIFLDFLKI
jgi:hypothetical protein